MSDLVTPNLRFRSLGHAAALACGLEAAAPKAGNVHRSADFADLTFYDFLLSGQLLGETIDQLLGCSLGELVLAIVQATRRQVRSNSNLGIALLLAPLALSFRQGALSACSVSDVLEASTARDASLIYEAIRVAQPGGLGTAPRHDVLTSSPPEHILLAMQLARDEDLIARQYVNGLADVFDSGVPLLLAETSRHGSLIKGIASAHLQLMSLLGDSLVRRKCGPELESQLRARATKVAEQIGMAGWAEGEPALADFDFWLRSDGHRRNPGATADLIAASLFVAILTGQLPWLVP